MTYNMVNTLSGGRSYLSIFIRGRGLVGHALVIRALHADAYAAEGAHEPEDRCDGHEPNKGEAVFVEAKIKRRDHQSHAKEHIGCMIEPLAKLAAQAVFPGALPVGAVQQLRDRQQRGHERVSKKRLFVQGVYPFGVQFKHGGHLADARAAFPPLVVMVAPIAGQSRWDGCEQQQLFADLI